MTSGVLNDFIIDGVQGNIVALPAFTGSGFLKLPQIDVQVIPEPTTISALTLASGLYLLGRRQRRN